VAVIVAMVAMGSALVALSAALVAMACFSVCGRRRAR
jgi:hypothetical protein